MNVFGSFWRARNLQVGSVARMRGCADVAKVFRVFPGFCEFYALGRGGIENEDRGG